MQDHILIALQRMQTPGFFASLPPETLTLLQVAYTLSLNPPFLKALSIPEQIAESARFALSQHQRHSLDVAQQQALIAVLIERKYQDAKWGNVRDNPHDLANWLRILFTEHYEARSLLDHEPIDTAAVLAHIRNLCAVALACLEQYGAPTR